MDGMHKARKLPNLAAEDLLQVTNQSHLKCCLCTANYPTDFSSLEVAMTVAEVCESVDATWVCTGADSEGAGALAEADGSVLVTGAFVAAGAGAGSTTVSAGAGAVVGAGAGTGAVTGATAGVTGA